MPAIPHKIKKTLNSFLDEIAPICSLDRVILYGSYAAGNANPESDIDLAIFSKSANDKNRLGLMSKILTCTPKYKLDLQPLVFSYQDFLSDENDFIKNEIKLRGIVLK